jgi:hypothetical protein
VPLWRGTGVPVGEWREHRLRYQRDSWFASATMPDDLYAYLPAERTEAVETWLHMPLRDCCICGAPVYPTDPRCLDPGVPEDAATVVHLSCAAAVE